VDKNRWFEIDLVKAACILGVVCIHSISRRMFTLDPVGFFLSDWTRFAVPGFIFAAGFLFKKGPVDIKRLATRLLTRIIPPYVVCSLIIVFLGLAERGGRPVLVTRTTILGDLLLGNTIGIYYFVFVIIYLYAFSFVLRLLSARTILALWVCTIVLTIVFYLNPFIWVPTSLKPVLPRGTFELFFIVMRHPCVHVFFYMSGWAANLYYPRIRPFLAKCFTPFLSIAILADIVVLYFIYQPKLDYSPKQLMIQVHVILTISSLLLLGIRKKFFISAVEYLSRNSYGIFLVHFPFVRYVQRLFPEATARFSFSYSTLVWLGGIVGSIVVIEIAKIVLRKYSPYVVGA
jgi:peptidoglycan/LPS O-acetylase OafA/YrhL